MLLTFGPSPFSILNPKALTNPTEVSYLGYQLQGFMLLGLWPSHLFYCKPQVADKPMRGKLLGLTMFMQSRQLLVFLPLLLLMD